MSIATTAAEPPAIVQTVTVTAARLPPSPGDAAFSIIRLNADQIAGRIRLDKALGEVPGVSLFRRTSSSAANPTTQGISLRSIGPSGAGRALVTLDGAPQNDPFGGWVIWSSLPPEAIEGATVVRGAGAGPYGAGALTGVVALDELSRPGAIQGDASFGGLGGRRGAVAATEGFGQTEVFLSGSIDHSDGWVPVRYGAGAADDRLTLDDWSFATRVQTQAGRGVIAVRLGAYREDRSAGLVGAQSVANGETATLTYAAAPTPTALGWRFQAWIRDSDLKNSSVAVAANRSTTTPANDQYSTPAIGWGANAALRGDAGMLVWETGADLRISDGEDREHFRFMNGAFTRNRIAGGRTLVGGAYAEGTVATGDWLFTGGGRIDTWNTSNGHRLETDLASGAVTFTDSPPNRSGAVPSGRFGFKRTLNEDVSFRGAAYSGFRPPTLNELYRPFRVGNDITEANAALKPERLYGVELGLQGRTGPLSWSVTGFYNRLDDAVTNVTIGVGPGVIAGFPGAGFIPAGGTLRQRQNAGTIEAKGVEADTSYALGDRLNLRGALAYTSSSVDGGTAAPQLTGLRPAQSPRFTATAGADWRPVSRLGLHGDLRYESARFDDDQNTRRLGPAARIDARADWSINRWAQVYVAADNLFDADIETGRAADGTVSYDAPRVFRVGLSLKL